MAENIREEDVILMTFSTYKRSGKTNYVKKIEKGQNYLEKGFERRACFFFFCIHFFIYFFARLLTIYCKEVIAAIDTNSDAADIFLALSHGMDEKRSAEEFPYVQIPTRYLKFTACFIQAHDLWCKYYYFYFKPTFSVPHIISKSMYKYNEFQNYNILCKILFTHIL